MIGLRASAAQQRLRGKAAETVTQLAHRNNLRLVIISRYRLRYTAGALGCSAMIVSGKAGIAQTSGPGLTEIGCEQDERAASSTIWTAPALTTRKTTESVSGRRKRLKLRGPSRLLQNAKDA